MSSEEKISPEEFDKELDSLLAGTTEKKPKNPKRKKIIIAAAIAILGITGIKLLSGGKDMVPVVDTVTPTRKTIQNRLTVTGPISGTDSVDVVSNLHAEGRERNKQCCIIVVYCAVVLTVGSRMRGFYIFYSKYV